MKKNIKYILPITLLILITIIISHYLIKGTESIPSKVANKETNIKTEKFMNRKVFIITPKDGKKSNKKILYFHGGSYVAEMSSEHWEFIANLVNDTGTTIILPDYPLLPKYNYKDVFDMVVPLYKKIIEHVDTQNLIIMGDSAGGGLSLALEEKLIENNIEIPNKTILISPWLDVSMSNEKIDIIEKFDKDLNKETLKLAGIAYSNNEDTRNYMVSPLYGDLHKLKSITIYTGTYDILNPDVHLLKEKLNLLGKNIDIKEYETAQHIWIIKQNYDKHLSYQGYQDLINQIRSSEEIDEK